ncbi:MaoC family dehydratase [soil metagenome]
MRVTATLDEFKAMVGQEVAVTDWFEITQERVDLFAKATDDLQWIHVDPERSRREGPFGGTIAHGFLTLALLPVLMDSVIFMSDVKMGVNYGLNKVRFPAPVPTGSRIRGRMKLLELVDIEGGVQMNWQVTMEREGGDKPVCVAESLSRRYK